MREWSADVAVDERLVRQLVAGRFPEVEPASLRLFAEGWDNAVWLADERCAFRFPRRTIAIPGVEREIAVLPKLAPRLPVAIPAPVFAGRPALGYLWPFFGAALLPGIEASDAALDDAARIRLAPVLAGFLRALHDIELEDELPLDPNWRGDMLRRVPVTRTWLAELQDVWPAPPIVDELLEQALALAAPVDRVVVHGDLHFRHSLLSVCAALSLYGHYEEMTGVKREALEGLERTVA